MNLTLTTIFLVCANLNFCERTVVTDSKASSNRQVMRNAAPHSDVVPIQDQDSDQQPVGQKKKLSTATFGAGCFWCVEAVYLRLNGVESVRSGYMGGFLENPTYQAVLTGQTGHAEVIQVEFDEDVIPYDTLLEVLFEVHNPTTLNRQGNDIGTQYRSVIFYHDDEQKETAAAYIKKLTDEKKFRTKIVTEVSAASTFYVAEDYHQNYFSRNPQNAYCRATIPPKLRKLQKNFKDKLKDD